MGSNLSAQAPREKREKLVPFRLPPATRRQLAALADDPRPRGGYNNTMTHWHVFCPMGKILARVLKN